MSRCYPYPHPAYAGKCASNEALICTIKLQRESEKTKSEKKDRRKEKKEKKREDKANICNEKKVPKDEKQYHAGKFGYPEACGQIKLQESAYDNMEKSSLTEEHGKPCCSSDSTENSGKRKRLAPPHATNNTRNPGTVIRIVLNSRKKEDRPTPSSSNNLSISLPTDKVESLSQKADVGVKHPASKLRITPPKSIATQQLTIISSNKEKLPCPDKQIDQRSSSKDEKKLPRPLRKYKALFENWVPPSMELGSVNDEEEEDWLSGSKKVVSQSAKRMKCCKEEVPNCGNAALQPQAYLLSDVDIYALPYTFPF